METQHIGRIELDLAHFSRQRQFRWRNLDTKELYRRVVGGLAWPRGLYPGALVVLVEHLLPMPGQNMRRVEIAAEYTDPDPGQLLRRASLWAETLSCRAWMTPLDAPEMQLAFDYNDGRHCQRLPQLELGMPPAMNGSRDFAAYNRLNERRVRGVKTLTFGEGSQVSREYKIRQRPDLSRGLEEYPLLAAFLWSLAAIDLDAPAEAGPGAATSGAYGAADSVAGY
jgi:hypothetical protein